MDQDVTYQDLEPMIEAEVSTPLPEGLVEPEWLELPEIEPEWLELPEIERDWLELPEIEPEWVQAIEQGEPEHLLEAPELEQGFDLEH
ncbi:MAG: hypothetical protein ACRDIV_23885 [Ktedonobacteraceae bacterium]